MESPPSLVLVASPPLPHALTISPPKNNYSPGSSDSSHTRPPSSYGNTLEEPERNSSETTIFTIYSMYSERRHSASPSISMARQSRECDFAGHRLSKEQRGVAMTTHSREVTDEDVTNESYSDSFRAPASRPPSSSTGSAYLTSYDIPGGGSSTSQRHSHSYLQNGGGSRLVSRNLGGFLETSASDPGLYGDKSELAYAADRNSLYGIGSTPTTAGDAERTASPSSMPPPTATMAARTNGSPSRRSRPPVGQPMSSWSKYVDLTLSDDGQPDLTVHRFNGGRMYASSRTTTTGTAESSENEDRPPRPPRGNGTPVIAAESEHRRNDSNGMTASTTHEGYVTAPQSVESTPATQHSGVFVRATSPAPPPPPPKPLSRPSSAHSAHKRLPPRPSSTDPSSPPPPSIKSVLSTPSKPASPRPSKTISPAKSSVASSSLKSSSIDRGENEEPEAFFVRSTYAHLDVTGVKGDGYEEGVERTRAKLGHNRESVQLAAAQSEARVAGEERSDITPKELEILQSLDRYGFYSVSTHDRLVSLPSTALAKPLRRIPDAPDSAPPSPRLLERLPDPLERSKAKEADRIAKWGRMLEIAERDRGGNVVSWRVRKSKLGKLRSRVFKGIPDRWRTAAWEVLLSRFVPAASGRHTRFDHLRTEYRANVDRPSTYDVQIDLDVPRTINGHVLFRTRYGLGQRSLFRVLHAFSLRCDECGYCQGMGPLAATLLCYYEPEKVYAMLVHLHDEYGMHGLFSPGFPGLLETIYVQERMIEKMMPGVYAAFKNHLISTTSYATKWYITLFANSVPFQMQLRLWDAFLLEGRDVFVVTAVAIVWVLKDHLTSNQANFETVLSLLSSFFVPEDEDSLLRWIERALDDKKLRSDMAIWRAEWQTLVAKGEEGGILL